MERKIGEIFELDNEWYQCVKSQDGSCKHCDMNFEGKCPIPIKECTESGRSDKSYVIFKKLEKGGEPITLKGRIFQKLRINNLNCNNCAFYTANQTCCKSDYIEDICGIYDLWVEIK